MTIMIANPDAAMTPEDLSDHDLDPFAFRAGEASGIVGLGGTSLSSVDGYAFQTAFLPGYADRSKFLLVLNDVVVDGGVLVLSVLSRSADLAEHERTEKSVRVDLEDSVRDGTLCWTVDFPTKPGDRYSLLGMIEGPSVISAAGILIRHIPTLNEQLDDPGSGPARASAVSRSQAAPLLVSTDIATFANPASQFCTERQFREDGYRDWSERLGLSGAVDRAVWERLFLMQVLDRYGLIRAGVRGVGFGQDIDLVAEHLSRAEGRVIDASMLAEEPDDEDAFRLDPSNIDFTWSLGVCDHFPTVEAKFAFVLNSLALLRPSGIAVHLMSVDLVPPLLDDMDTDRSMPSQRDLEKFAFKLIAVGHDFAQLKFERPDGRMAPALIARHGPRMVGSFGLILRRR